jgi:hypothetical protein
MNENKETMLAELVKVSRQYQKSIRIDTDIGHTSALQGYISHSSAQAALATMAKQISESSQRAFTWTGPYGGGKSSLAVALAGALSGESTVRFSAREALNLKSTSIFDMALPVRNGWLTLPIVGERTSILASLIEALKKNRNLTKSSKAVQPTNATELVAAICEQAKRQDCDGALILIDEMGKFLEASALGIGDDVYFFQELAEAAARSAEKIVIVGILHQSFAQYAGRLGIETRDDWNKVQGRYSDIPLVAASDEVVDLVCRAISSEIKPQWVEKASLTVADAIRQRRPALGKNFSATLAACWPLHPAMAALLGPISRRQFGQNERSTFGFLASVETNGFRSYLDNTQFSDTTSYRPNDYLDYLRINLEQAISASSDGHRWAQAIDAIERTEAKSEDNLLVELIKNIAVIDLFRNGSGLSADLEVLSSLFPTVSEDKINDALKQLADWRVVLYKRHVRAWSIFEGSDFDIDAAINQIRANMPDIDLAMLTELAKLHPVVAKRHYHETGTMRWMSMQLCHLDDAQKIATSFKPSQGEFGLFLLALPSKNTSARKLLETCQSAVSPGKWPIAVSVPANYKKITTLGTELLALQNVQSRHELNGDAVARREVQARLLNVRSNIEEQLREAVAEAKWAVGKANTFSGMRLLPIASNLADDLYHQAPEVWSELVNRDALSSNSVKARRDLLYRMLDNETELNLGISGYPAERGLYETLLKSTGLHRKDELGHWSFKAPDENSAPTFKSLWQSARNLFETGIDRVDASAIYALWMAPPLGIKRGMLPVFFIAFALAHKSNVAIYKDRIFIPKLNDADIDELLQDHRRFSVRWIAIDEDKNRVLGGIADILKQINFITEIRDPLEAARSLVAFIFKLPSWTQRTHRVSERARAVRDILLKANDPHKVLFIDLATTLGGVSGNAYIEALRSPIIELSEAYSMLLRNIESAMLDALGAASSDLDHLRRRAKSLIGVTGDLRQDAFAARLAKHDGSKESVEGLLSLAVNKPARDWTDRDADAAALEVSRIAVAFRQTEAFVTVSGRKPSSEAFAVVIGTGAQTQTLSRTFSLSDRSQHTVEVMTNDLVSRLKDSGMGIDELLAVLARTGLELTSNDDLIKGNS